jgi:hypothetical protein
VVLCPRTDVNRLHARSVASTSVVRLGASSYGGEPAFRCEPAAPIRDASARVRTRAG